MSIRTRLEGKNELCRQKRADYIIFIPLSDRSYSFILWNTKNLSPFSLFYFLIKYYIVLLQLSYFSPLLSSAQPTTHSHSQSPPYCPCPWVIHTYSLTCLFPFLPPLSPSFLLSGHRQFVLYFIVSGSILLSCLFCWLGSI